MCFKAFFIYAGEGLEVVGGTSFIKRSDHHFTFPGWDHHYSEAVLELLAVDAPAGVFVIILEHLVSLDVVFSPAL